MDANQGWIWFSMSAILYGIRWNGDLRFGKILASRRWAVYNRPALEKGTWQMRYTLTLGILAAVGSWLSADVIEKGVLGATEEAVTKKLGPPDEKATKSFVERKEPQ